MGFQRDCLSIIRFFGVKGRRPKLLSESPRFFVVEATFKKETQKDTAGSSNLVFLGFDHSLNLKVILRMTSLIVYLSILMLYFSFTRLGLAARYFKK